MPRPTKGPFSLDLNDLFAEAIAAVRARREITEELETLQDPPDLHAVIVANREMLFSSVRDQFDRTETAGNRLHELLVEAAGPAGVEVLNGLVEGVTRLRSVVDEFSLAEPSAERTHELRQIRLRLERRTNVVAPRRADLPDDLAAELEAELEDCETLLAELERREVDLLTAARPRAREALEFRALETNWEVHRNDTVQVLESAVFSCALTALNTAVTEETAPRMRVKSFDGLRQSVTTERIVLTDAYERLERMIRERSDGSFGIAGPRGVGKSTLVRFFATTRGVRGLPDDEEHERSAGKRPRLGVVVSAPVAYQPRDFVLHLYAELCKRVIGGDGDTTARPEIEPEPRFAGVSLRWTHAWLMVLGGGALAVTAGLLALLGLRRPLWVVHPFADAGTVLLGTAMIATAALFVRNVKIVPARSAVRLQARRKDKAWPAVVVPALVVDGLVMITAGNGWQSHTWQLLGALAGALISIPAFVLARRVRSLLSRVAFPDELPLSAEWQLRELAVERLRGIRYQQSFAHERSLAVKAGGAIGFDVGGKRGQTRQEIAKTYPELVGDLRAFLAAVAQQHTVVIGVDELDKLRSHQDVENFLNDIKSVFGVTGCFFLASVSEDAAAGFERRGAPFRDVFDSAFDDVLSVRLLDMGCSRRIVYGLLLGWTKPFVGLCYVLSGGLARDLRRSARELVSHRGNGDEIELGAAALAMCRREAEARTDAIRHELMRDPFDALNIDLLTKVAALTPAEATVPSLLKWHDELSSWAPAVAPGEPIPSAARLGSELAAFLLFAATVLEFFDPAEVAERIREAEKPGGVAKCLSTLATARRSLALSPGISIAHTRLFRTAWTMDS
ncbi:hypothetical protein [Amycolatopsis sp. lyj-23]|uniref:hypothetical protein n=1 Tax=Amycolatopsis sp. lyj-23 TaxID=2789283 RepID=UPI00397CDFAE